MTKITRFSPLFVLLSFAAQAATPSAQCTALRAKLASTQRGESIPIQIPTRIAVDGHEKPASGEVSQDYAAQTMLEVNNGTLPGDVRFAVSSDCKTFQLTQNGHVEFSIPIVNLTANSLSASGPEGSSVNLTFTNHKTAKGRSLNGVTFTLTHPETSTIACGGQPVRESHSLAMDFTTYFGSRADADEVRDEATTAALSKLDWIEQLLKSKDDAFCRAHAVADTKRLPAQPAPDAGAPDAGADAGGAR